ncbi:MAG: FAD:protein FMN transferase [Microbacteriaceae bacterium]|nr:MAG: FAD:protein FMN transferase [Microbacteriaceae bacterium]
MRRVQTVMGFPVSVDLRDQGDFTDAIARAFGALTDADRRFSTYRPDSEVSRVNRGLVAPAEYSDDLREVLAIGASVQRGSRGAFALRVPGGAGLDTDGVVKGWAVQRAAEVLEGAGARNFCINAGGDVVVRGSAGEHSGWNIGVRSPWDPTTMVAVFSLRDEAIATSGAYERGDHIVDGRTGLAARAGLASVSVIAPSLTMADVLATAVFALGEDGVQWAAHDYECGVFAIRYDGGTVTAGPLPREVAA